MAGWVPPAAWVEDEASRLSVGPIVQESIVSLMKRTDPSAKATFNPPGCKLDAETRPAQPRPGSVGLAALKSFGRTIVVKRVPRRFPTTHQP